MSAKDGHAAITRPYVVGSATAMLAARLAALPAASSAHGSPPPAPAARESASRVMDEAMIMPSTESGISAAVQADSPWAGVRVHVAVEHDRGDAGQQQDAGGRRRADPPIREAGAKISTGLGVDSVHDRVPSLSRVEVRRPRDAALRRLGKRKSPRAHPSCLNRENPVAARPGA